MVSCASSPWLCAHRKDNFIVLRFNFLTIPCRTAVHRATLLPCAERKLIGPANEQLHKYYFHLVGSRNMCENPLIVEVIVLFLYSSMMSLWLTCIFALLTLLITSSFSYLRYAFVNKAHKGRMGHDARSINSYDLFPSLSKSWFPLLDCVYAQSAERNCHHSKYGPSKGGWCRRFLASSET